MMILVNKKILFGGVAMIITGITISLYLNAIMPIGVSGMTEDAAIQLILEQRENQDYTMLAGILIGIGFLLTLISFGARKHKGNSLKKEKKHTV